MGHGESQLTNRKRPACYHLYLTICLLVLVQVCAEGFEDEDATVVCRQLNYVLPNQPALGRAIAAFPP